MNANPYSGVKVNTDKTVLGLNIFERYYFRLASNSNSVKLSHLVTEATRLQNRA